MTITIQALAQEMSHAFESVTRPSSGETFRTLPEHQVVATRPLAVNGLEMTVSATQAEIARLKRMFPLLPDRAGLFAEWERIVFSNQVSGRPAHDARLVAAMRTHGMTEILTFNGADFRRFPGITVLDPAAP